MLQDEAEERLNICHLNMSNCHLPDASFQPGTDPSQLTFHNTPLLFIDTDMYVMKVWCEYVFGKCHQFILDEIVERKYDLYLLCKPDIDWVKDELREYPDEKIRIELYHIYRDILINQSIPWVEMSGDYEERLRMGVEAVERVLLSLTFE